MTTFQAYEAMHACGAVSLCIIDFLPQPVINAWDAGMLAIARRQKAIKEVIDGMNEAAQASA